MTSNNPFEMVADHPFYSLKRYEYLTQEKLIGTRCKQCGTLFFPTKPACVQCNSLDMELVEFSGRGKLAAFTVITVGTPLMIEEGYGRETPYCSGIVQLEEGPKVTARILGFDLSRPEEIKIGTPVSAEFIQVTHQGVEVTFLAFRSS